MIKLNFIINTIYLTFLNYLDYQLINIKKTICQTVSYSSDLLPLNYGFLILMIHHKEVAEIFYLLYLMTFYMLVLSYENSELIKI